MRMQTSPPPVLDPASPPDVKYSLVDSKRELFRRRIAMLLSANSTVVFFCCFVQLEMAITRRRSASLAERMHRLRRQRFEAARNFHVLMQHLQRVDTANCGRDRQAHCVTKRLSRSNAAI